MKRTIGLLAATAVASLALVGLSSGSASASSPGSFTATLDAYGILHTFDNINYNCGTDGTVTFDGFGSSATEIASESVSGVLDTTAHTFTFHALYLTGVGGTPDGRYWDGWGTLAAGTTGSIAYTGFWSVNTTPPVNMGTLSGVFNSVPDCAPAPVVGNHGQYVSGAAHAGIKGQALAAIAKDPTKVGPYPG